MVEGAARFSVNGVAPVGHLGTLPVLTGKSLARYDVVWAAAGSQD